MAIELIETRSSNVIEVRVTGKLTRADYILLVPETDALIRRHGKIRILLVMHDFHGWSAAAIWEDIKFDLNHFNHIERIAMVGDSKWERQMAAFCRPFTSASIRFFAESEVNRAREWIETPAEVHA